jgi:phosphocarrier protein
VPKIIKLLKVKNEMGIHTRPATTIVKLLQRVKSDVTFQLGDDVVNAKSILSILMLAACCNSHITVTVEGDDAEEAMTNLQYAFDNKFGE